MTKNGLLMIQSMGLGDLIFALPAVKALKRTYPDEPITFLTHLNHAELLAHPGRLCAPDDYEKMSSLIQEVLTDHNARANLVREGQLKAQSFQWSSTASQILKIYRRLHSS